MQGTTFIKWPQRDFQAKQSGDVERVISVTREL